MKENLLKKYWISLLKSLFSIPQTLYTVHWTGPRNGHLNGNCCTPCPICDGKTIYYEQGEVYWKARNMQRAITGRWDETRLKPIESI